MGDRPNCELFPAFLPFRHNGEHSKESDKRKKLEEKKMFSSSRPSKDCLEEVAGSIQVLNRLKEKVNEDNLSRPQHAKNQWWRKIS